MENEKPNCKDCTCFGCRDTGMAWELRAPCPHYTEAPRPDDSSGSNELAGCITGCLREYPERCGVYLKYGATELYFERHMAKGLLADLTSVIKKWDSE